MKLSWLFILSAVLGGVASAQTTQGLISGRLQSSVTGAPVAGAAVSYSNFETSAAGTTQSDKAGYYYLPLLSPGFYQIRVAAKDYQPQELHELELPVAARLDLEFRLRPSSDVWESGQFRSVFLPGSRTIVTFYGPDVDSSRSGSFEAQRGRNAPLESTVSQVIDPLQIKDLPLAGRDVYTMLVTQPGVTADSGTARGLGLSINGQRPSSSNFLLDGVENNNYLVTGPLTPVAPEAIQEYRVSTNNFSAEYGRTSGFLANAVTRSGTNSFHGVGYFYLKNKALNANGFQGNRSGTSRIPAKESRPGFQVGGPILKQQLFFSSSFENLRSRSQRDPVVLFFPTSTFTGTTLSTSVASALLKKYPPPFVNDSRLFAPLTMSPPVSIDRNIALERLDYTPGGGKNRLMGRLALARLGRPDFIWSPYRDFVSGLEQNTASLAITLFTSLTPSLMNEARAGFSTDDLHWDRAHPEIPTLTAQFADAPQLPGSGAFYAYKNKNETTELTDNLTWVRGKHVVTTGAGALLRDSSGYLTAGRDAQYVFMSPFDFSLDRPRQVRVPLDRTVLPSLVSPDSNRSYRYNQFFLFAQDTFKISRRLTTNFGVRYDQYGTPRNVGTVKDLLVELGSGDTLIARLGSARLARPGSSDQKIFGGDDNDFAVRLGFAYDVTGSARSLVRGAYGVFYDRPFDNLWQNVRNNSVALPTFSITAARTNYLAPVDSVLQSYASQVGINTRLAFPPLTLIQPDIRTPYVHSFFLGVQQRVTNTISVGINGLGSLGRKLLTSDTINRQFTTNTGNGRPNANLPDIAYRGNQGISNYYAMTVAARYRTARAQVHLAYTWSHTIDNQSDPLSGDFFDLSFTRVTSGDDSGRASFARQFDSRSNRGNSDFDQRHNLVLFSFWDIPGVMQTSKVAALLRNWKVAELAAFRTGFPYSVIGTSTASFGGGLIINNRPNLIDPAKAVSGRGSGIAGGQVLLNASGFQNAGISQLGNVGRNAFRGPGLYNVDLSVSRSFGVKYLGEAGRFVVRADAFNFLNHANLGNPDNLLTSPTFGQALYGRQGKQSGFPAVSPLNETARQVQLALKIEF